MKYWAQYTGHKAECIKKLDNTIYTFDIENDGTIDSKLQTFDKTIIDTEKTVPPACKISLCSVSCKVLKVCIK